MCFGDYVDINNNTKDFCCQGWKSSKIPRIGCLAWWVDKE